MSFVGERSLSSVSVVTPTLRRPGEVRQLLHNLAAQQHLPLEIIMIDGAPGGNTETEEVVRELAPRLPFHCEYVRHGGGTAIQRNAGIDRARGAFVAFIDDDMLLEPEFFATVLRVFASDTDSLVGAVAGYVVNDYLDPATSRRWRWYRWLRLFSTYEPGRFDFATGYPINRNLQPPHGGVREIDFAGANCIVWRRSVFDGALRYSSFFTDFGVAEDAHLALHARAAGWRILECGGARCTHSHSPHGRDSERSIARKTAINYRYLFVDLVPRRSRVQEMRFWLVQGVDLLRMVLAALSRRGTTSWSGVAGKVEGIHDALRVRPTVAESTTAPVSGTQVGGECG